MKTTNEKKITGMQVFKTLIGIDTVILIGMMAWTVYGWATGADTNYTVLASFAAPYAVSLAIYEELKKKEAKKASN